MVGFPAINIPFLTELKNYRRAVTRWYKTRILRKMLRQE